MTRTAAVVLAAVVAGAAGIGAQVSPSRIVNATGEPHNWLTYSGAYFGQRYSPLTQITPANVRNLEIKWLLQNQVFGSWESSPIVVDGVMYLTQRPNDVLAVDAKTGRLYWIYKYVGAADVKVCCGANNRGLGIHGHTLFMGTLDAHLVAVDARTGRQVWNTKVAEASLGYSISLAPLVVKDTVIVGVGGGEYGIRGFIAAYDVASGRERWRFYTVPAPGEPGGETWEGDAWKTGGGSLWVTGTYDPALNLTYWGVGNPGPDFNPSQRKGDNLYTDSVVALDADTGVLKWHFQFTPNDAYDWDAIQVPVLVDANWQGRPAKLLMAANRNGFFYVLDRVTGKFLLGKPFVKVNWASGLDASGRPIQTPQPPGMPTFPGQQGGTNWWSPSYSPRTGLFYVGAWEDVSGVFTPAPAQYKPGGNFMGGGFRATRPAPDAPVSPNIGRPPINNWTDAQSHGVILALDPATGDRKWTFPLYDLTESGIMTTASDLVFTGSRDGYLLALDARTGAPLWKSNLSSAQMRSAPTTYMVDGRQFISYISGNVLITFGLRE
ncbi:MAG: PQQ-dependent dehydrogenase, methanol/ethanol family [Acidobacteria bacterium]|nr:PQQ-dependent dehydrogenase, methanol/ethanol family [Acidobacteriota bacterium]